MSLTGQPGGPPTRVGVSIGDLGAGLYAMIGTQAALLQRERTGQGERVDVAMLDCQVALLENSIARYEVDKRIPEPIGSRHPSITPFDVFQAKDGWIVIAAGNDILFQRLCDILALPDVRADSRFTTNPLRCEYHSDLKKAIENRLQDESCKHWIELLMKSNIPTGEYNNLAQVLDSPQIKEREMLLEVRSKNGSSLTVAGNPIHIGSFISKVNRNPPALDQDRAEILSALNVR